MPRVRPREEQGTAMITFEGRLGIGDMSRHAMHGFDVPDGCRQLRAVFEHTPAHPGVGDIPHQLSISLYDPVTGRGTRHCNDDQTVVLTERYASPGYDAGPLPAGRWTVSLDTHRILPPGNVDYTIKVWLSDTPEEWPASEFHAANTASRGPGWYRGDLHAHSLHSDAEWSVAELTKEFRRRQLDFAALTDHNTVSGLPEFDSLGGDDLLTLGGQELTTFYGHCLSLGPRHFIDWRVLDGETMGEVAQRHVDAGALFIIAHPMSPGHPCCTGCNWQFTDMMPGIAPAVEVWNGPFRSDWTDYNAQALALYYRWLNKGHRLVATAGSDAHDAYPDDARVGVNAVFADDLAEDAILAAIGRGHLYLTAGPELIMTGTTANDDTVPMGGVADDLAGITLHWGDSPAGAVLHVLGPGPGGAETVHRQTAASEGSLQVDASDLPDSRWLGTELRDDRGELLAMANPIFLSA